jgi:hypothetical protein
MRCLEAEPVTTKCDLCEGRATTYRMLGAYVLFVCLHCAAEIDAGPAQRAQQRHRTPWRYHGRPRPPQRPRGRRREDTEMSERDRATRTADNHFTPEEIDTIAGFLGAERRVVEAVGYLARLKNKTTNPTT